MITEDLDKRIVNSGNGYRVMHHRCSMPEFGYWVYSIEAAIKLLKFLDSLYPLPIE